VIRRAGSRWDLASHLTHRDQEICALLWEQRVMTTLQLAAVAFGGGIEVAKHRLLLLHRLGVLSRFRPLRLRGEGSSPYHYTLGPAGAAVLASARATTVRALGYQAEDMLALAHSPRLAHIVGVNDVLAGLTAAARRRGATLAAWWSERQCAAHWGAVVRPDACGRWQEDGVDGHFFVEYDRGSETPERVAAKVADYAMLASVTGYVTPVLVWLPGARRETAVHRALADARARTVPIATGFSVDDQGPADRVWLPLGASCRATLSSVLRASACDGERPDGWRSEAAS
jgi:hypothetical protein